MVMKSRIWLKMAGCVAILAGVPMIAATSAHAATVVALGASNTYGKGVARNQAFPAQLEAILRAKGLNVHVITPASMATPPRGCCGGWMASFPRASAP
jgi:acyl-CoA thioesterase-1